MSNLGEALYQKGIEKGREIGKDYINIYIIKSLMDSLNLTVDQAMDALKLNPEEKKRYASMI